MSDLFPQKTLSSSPYHLITSSPLRVLLISLYLFCAFSVSAQEKKGEAFQIGRRIVDTLCSPAMHGRGYLYGGDSIAANFIKTRFQAMGVKALKNLYYQPVSFTVNVFDHAAIYADGKALKVGADFIPFHKDPSGSGKCKVAYADDALVANKKKFKKFKKQDLSNMILIINDTGAVTPELNELNGLATPKAIIVMKDKLTWSVAQEQSKFIQFDVLRSAMPTIPKEIQFNVQSRLKKHNTQNVIGFVPGTAFPDSFIVFSAHYDHLGQIGTDAIFPGANDNASGVAMLLTLARHYAKNPPRYSMVFMAFCGEEAGLVGSKYYVNHPWHYPFERTKFLLNLDLMGTGEDGITVVNGSVFPYEFEMLKKANKAAPDVAKQIFDVPDLLKTINTRGKAANSDHYWFSEKGIHSFFIYTMGGTKAYHDVNDKADQLPLTEFDDLFLLITRFATLLQE